MFAEDWDGRLNGQCVACGNEPSDEKRRAYVLDTGLCPRCDRTHHRVNRKNLRERKAEDAVRT